MDSKTRILTKAITWQVMGLFAMGLVGYVFTGSVTASGGIALSGAILGFVSYLLHEFAWSKITWGRLSSPTDMS